MSCFTRILVFLASVAGISTTLAQHEYAPVEIAQGGQIYRSTCVACHGQDGRQVEDVNLTDPVFLQENSDETIAAIIRNGVPGTAMLANNYSESQSMNIVGYLRDLASQGRVTPQGNAELGKAIFESGDCLDCHRVGSAGSRIGPDLSRIGLLRPTLELEQALLEPDETVLPENRYVEVITANGQRYRGRLLNHDPVTVQMLDTDERLRLLRKSELSQFSILEQSEMPSYADTYTASQLEDLLSYLASLTGVTP